MIEVERKFLLNGDGWPQASRVVEIRQGYIAERDGVVCRVRSKNDQYYLSLKARIDNVSSYDYEYPIPSEDGMVMLESLCDRPALIKTRHEVADEGLVWEIDEFHGVNSGLVVVEIELPNAEYSLTLPPWVGDEVTDDLRYTNSALYKCPWTEWRS